MARIVPVLRPLRSGVQRAAAAAAAAAVDAAADSTSLVQRTRPIFVLVLQCTTLERVSRI